MEIHEMLAKLGFRTQIQLVGRMDNSGCCDVINLPLMRIIIIKKLGRKKHPPQFWGPRG